MARLIQTLALGAALVTLGWGLWHGLGVLTVLRRVVTAYLACFFSGGLLLLAARAVAVIGRPEPEVAEPAEPAARRRRAPRPESPAPAPPAQEQPADVEPAVHGMETAESGQETRSERRL